MQAIEMEARSDRRREMRSPGGGCSPSWPSGPPPADRTVDFRQVADTMIRMLLQLDGREASLLVGLKFLGTLLSLGFVSALPWRNRRMGTIVAGGVAFFQFGLLCYLVLG